MIGHIFFSYIIFPGFLFTSILGLILFWVDRKVTARVQFRVGPPWYQNFADFFKLMIKETLVPYRAEKLTFITMPILGLASIVVVSVILWKTNLFGHSFAGDLIVVLYLMVLSSLTGIFGAFASGSPLAVQGASREMKLILAYELPFIIAVFTPVVAIGQIRLEEIVQYQNNRVFFIGVKSFWNVLSMIIAFIVGLLAVQAKLGFIPFDAPEAECEIASGIFAEYSGPLLGVIKLTRQMMLFVFPVFLSTLYLGGLSFSGWQILYSILKIVIILVLIVLIKNTNPRLRIDQAIRFFWFKVFPLSIIGFILALM